MRRQASVEGKVAAKEVARSLDCTTFYHHHFISVDRHSILDNVGWLVGWMVTL